MSLVRQCWDSGQENLIYCEKKIQFAIRCVSDRDAQRMHGCAILHNSSDRHSKACAICFDCVISPKYGIYQEKQRMNRTDHSMSM